MAMNTPVGDNGTPEDILSVAEKHFDRILEEVEGVIATLRGGDTKATREAAVITRDLNMAVQTVFDERVKVEKLHKPTEGIAQGYALDFDTARDEIGRRMACLRAAGGATGVSE